MLNNKITIVGAGVSGILTAIELKKRGYENITLFEKNDRPLNLTYTYSHDNHNFDFATKLIPAVGLEHNGIYTPLNELFKATGVKLKTTPNPLFYNFAQQKKVALPACMRKYSKLKVIKDFAKAYDLLLALSHCKTFVEIYEKGIIHPGENTEAWAKRNDIAAFGTFINYLVDLFNMGPANDIPAEFVLVSRVHFVAPYLHGILTKAGVKQYLKLFGTKKHPAFKQFLEFKSANINYYVVEEGYEEFFKRLINLYELDVQYNATITNLTKTTEGLQFIVNDTEQVNCDKLIYCCPPATIAKIAYNKSVINLTNNIAPTRTIRTWAFELAKWDTTALGNAAYVVDSENKQGLATDNLKINGELMYVAKETADSNLIVSPVYIPNGMTEAQKEEALERSLNSFGMQLKKIVTHKDFIWPNYFSLAQSKNGWHNKFEQLQGLDGAYYLGECFSGIGVPTILEHTLNFTQQYFTPPYPPISTI